MDIFLKALIGAVALIVIGVGLRMGWILGDIILEVADSVWDACFSIAEYAIEGYLWTWRKVKSIFRKESSQSKQKGKDNGRPASVFYAEVIASSSDFSRPVLISNQKELEAFMNGTLGNGVDIGLEFINSEIRSLVQDFVQIPVGQRPKLMKDFDFCWSPYKGAFIAAMLNGSAAVCWRPNEVAFGHISILNADETKDVQIEIDKHDQARFDMHGVYTLDGQEV